MKAMLLSTSKQSQQPLTPTTSADLDPAVGVVVLLVLFVAFVVVVRGFVVSSTINAKPTEQLGDTARRLGSRPVADIAVRS